MPPENDDWKSTLPENLREHKSLADIKDVGALADSFVNAQQMLGQSIRIPSDDAGDEAKKAFYAKLTDQVPGLIPTPDPEDADSMNALFKRMGRPDSAEGYEIPEGIEPQKVADLAKVAHEAGITKAQFKTLIGAVGETATKKQEQQSEEHLAGIRKLKQEWGITYEDNVQLVGQVMKGTGAPAELQEAAANQQLSADSMRWLHNIGKQLGTEGINFHKDESTTRLAPQEALQRAQEMINDKEGPYWNAGHPDHKSAVNRYVDYMRAAQAGGLV